MSERKGESNETMGCREELGELCQNSLAPHMSNGLIAGVPLYILYILYILSDCSRQICHDQVTCFHLQMKGMNERIMHLLRRVYYISKETFYNFWQL